MKILLIGPQGSGKSTQAKFLAEYLHIPYISTGDIFRQIASEDTGEGKRIKQIIESGNLVDDQTTANLLKLRLDQPDCQNGYILDGYPRNLEQKELVANLSFDKVLYISVLEDMVVERLLNRGRADDTDEGIRKRLNLYKEQTQPLLDLYKNQEILVEVDGRGDIQTVQNEIKKSI